MVKTGSFLQVSWINIQCFVFRDCFKVLRLISGQNGAKYFAKTQGQQHVPVEYSNFKGNCIVI